MNAIFIATVAFTAVFGAAAMASAETAAGPTTKPSIVLIHGAFANGSSWAKVIPLLQAQGFPVVAVHSPLTSLDDDVAAAVRAIRLQPGRVVLVGHSWGGVVITQAGNEPKVDALVYVDAVAPDSGQSIADATAGWSPAPWIPEAVKDDGDFLWLPASTIDRLFAQDLPAAERALVTITQGPWAVRCGADRVAKASWRDKRSWWVIGRHDHMIAPDLQARMAKTAKSAVTELRTGHLAMLADPAGVTSVIAAAATAVGPTVQGNAPARVAGQFASALAAPAAVVPLGVEPPAKLIVDAPLAAPLARGRVVIPYRAENVRIVQIFGPDALDVSPRVGHVHVTVDDAPWHWLDASGEPLTITGLPTGPHKVLVELVNANHQTLDYAEVAFEVPFRGLTKNDVHADGFRSAPKQ